MTPPGLTDRIALVTGAAGGLGRAIAATLAAAGAAVVLTDRADCEPVVRAIAANGGVAIALPADLASPEGLAPLAAAAIAWRGSCDILVNNAGVFPQTSLDDLDYAAWRAVMAINLDAPMLLARAVAPAMRARGFGRIVNIVSAGFVQARPGSIVYVASKMGLIGLTRGLASALGNSGVTVNAVAPGLMRTEAVEALFGTASPVFDTLIAQQSIHRQVEPDDVAGLVAFLASDAAAMITGQTILADGGAGRL